MTIEDRISRLENDNRKLKRALWTLGLLAIALACMGQRSAAPASEPLRARSIEVVGEDGAVVIRLGVTGNGEGRITTYDPKGHEIIEITALEDGQGCLTTFSPKEATGEIRHPLVWIGSARGPDDVSQGSLATYGTNAQPLVHLSATSEGLPLLGTYLQTESGGMGSPLLELDCSPQGGGRIIAYEKNAVIATWPR